jgi:hypothetical protein
MRPLFACAVTFSSCLTDGIRDAISSKNPFSRPAPVPAASDSAGTAPRSAVATATALEQAAALMDSEPPRAESQQDAASPLVPFHSAAIIGVAGPKSMLESVQRDGDSESNAHATMRARVVRVLTIAGLLACLAVTHVGTADGQDLSARTWRDVTGEFSVVASLVRQTEQSVVLLTGDGRRINVRIAKLSEPDREYLRKLAAEANAPDSTAATEATITARLAGSPLPAGTIPLPELAKKLEIPVFVAVYSLERHGMLVNTPVELGEGFQTLQEQLDEALEKSQLGVYRARTILTIGAIRDFQKRTDTHLYRLSTPQNAGGVQTVIQRVEQTEPDSWESRGGRGSINAIGGIYAICQTQKVHRQLAADLRRKPLPSSYAYPLEDIAVTISQTRVSPNDVFDAIHNECGRVIELHADETIGYSEDDFARKALDLDLRSVSARDLLDVTLKQFEHTWREDGEKIIVEGKDVAEETLFEYEFQFRVTPWLTASDVMNTIQSSIAPDMWDVFGGPGQIDMPRPGVFRVQQGEPAMREVKRFVHDLTSALQNR